MTNIQFAVTSVACLEALALIGMVVLWRRERCLRLETTRRLVAGFRQLLPKARAKAREGSKVELAELRAELAATRKERNDTVTTLEKQVLDLQGELARAGEDKEDLKRDLARSEGRLAPLLERNVKLQLENEGIVKDMFRWKVAITICMVVGLLRLLVGQYGVTIHPSVELTLVPGWLAVHWGWSAHGSTETDVA